MTRYYKFPRMAVIAFSAALLTPLAQAQSAGGYAAMPAAAPAGQSQSGGGDMKAMMTGRHDKMQAMQMSGDPDVDFAQMMRMHHQGAIDMAEAELKNGKNPEMKAMAKGIIAAQKKEIAKFDKFLSQHRSGK